MVLKFVTENSISIAKSFHQSISPKFMQVFYNSKPQNTWTAIFDVFGSEGAGGELCL
jgi:hypothetical protein